MALPSADPLDHHYRGEHPIRTLAYLFREDRGRLGLGVLAYFVKHSPTFLLPLVTADVIDIVVRHRPISGLWVDSGILMALLMLNLPGHLLYVRCFSHSIRRMGVRLRSALCWRLQHLSIGYHSRVSAGVLQAKVIRDVEAIEQAAQQTADSGLAAVVTLIGATTVIAVRDPVWLPVFAVLVPVTVLLAMALRKPMKQDNETFRTEVEQLSSRVVEMTNLIPITRAHGLERDAFRRVDGTLRRVLAAGLRLDLINGTFGAMAWIALNCMGVACLTGAAYAAYTGALGTSPGDVVMLSAFFTTLIGAVGALMNLTPVITRGLASVRSVGEVLQAPDIEENEGRERVEQVRGEFVFDDVTFAYPDADRASVADVDLTVRPGETVAFVGASGAGKSTILNMVIGFIRPTSGRILLDGRDMTGLDLRTYRKHLSIVPQETTLFDGTIRDNVLYGLAGVGDDELLATLRDANALEFVERLPDGLDTRVGEKGARLSGGQKQRLAIARALVRDPRVLILDEATSALDTQSERLIQEALGRLVAGRTTFVVAHRLSTVRNADRIVVMDGGRIVESGTHDELVARGGAYASLHGVRAS
ncbi:ABC transporter ATP-binding protein [Catenulispora subtropica]|uniref:ABC transporter ATP-binding protein n=1 Tax=Catenulispora subtropica TaxID=450798 RepID=A0ABN2T3P3_9ACTN